MSHIVLIMGESGTGKSTSLRNLNPEETFIINVLNKPLPFRGFKKNYKKLIHNVIEDTSTGNYYTSDNAKKIVNLIQHINFKRPEIKNIIIDDWQYLMGNEFMRRATEKGYDKFSEIGQNGWIVIDELQRCRDDMEGFVLAHTELDNQGHLKCKTIGKMLDQNITIEGMFTTILHTCVYDGRYTFLTQNDGTHIAKSPMEMFEDKYIDNDLAYVKSKTNEYFNKDIAA